MSEAGLRAALGELEDVLLGAEPVAELGRRLQGGSLLSVHDPALLFEVELRFLVRSGPRDAALAPPRLVEVAQEAAAAGILPLAVPTDLRRTLEAALTSLRKEGAWHSDVPPWFFPLPDARPAERLRAELSLNAGLPPAADMAMTLAGSSMRWWKLPRLLDAERARRIHDELESAHEAGRLGLERPGVGIDERISRLRSDSVCYATGREPELLASAPSAAALVQWALEELPGCLQVVPGRRLHAPASAMLARYPGPSAGYAPHMDNPGRKNDNGRALTFLLYLNECEGGELALWAEGKKTVEAPTEVVVPRGGSAVVFNARTVPHQVLPLREGPARWALALWLNDGEEIPIRPPRPNPCLSLTEVLLPIADPPLPEGTVLFHELDDETPSGTIVVRRRGARTPRTGIVTTAYRVGEALDAWCAHHFDAGFDHLVVVFDHLEDDSEAEDATRLREKWPEERLTIWAGEAMRERWVARDTDLLALVDGGGSSYAVSARQTLNASAALHAARSDELGGAPLDYLVHLDADELFRFEGAPRGGASAGEHFAAASEAGLVLLRYLNHELLLPEREGAPRRFKVNPRLASARLGRAGWSSLVRHLAMDQDDERPYFSGYLNGKSAVAVAVGRAAAGVHGWYLEDADAPARLLAGPSILHLRFGTPEAFRRKYLDIVDAPAPAGPLPFEPAPAEVAAVERIQRLREEGKGDDAVAKSLEDLHRRMTSFSDEDVELLAEAGLLLKP